MNGVPDRPELLLRERAWLQALARQLVQRHEGADELAHDAMAVACTQPGPLRAGPRAWLAAILKKQLAGMRRSAHRRSAREAQAARPEAVPPAADTVARFEVQRDVANAVLALSEPYRTTVLLRFWEELSPSSIGKRMSVPVETVRTRIKRGLALLRERLDRAHGGDRRAWAMPLWSAAQQVGSFASFLAGVTLMTAMQKVAIGGAAVAVALLSWIAWPWLSAGAGPASPPERTPAAVTAEMPSAAAVEPKPAVDANERSAVPATESVPRLVVTGTVVDDETDAPLAGVPVRLVEYPYGEVLGIETSTASDGTFVMREVNAPRSGRQVVVAGPDYAVARQTVAFDSKRPEPQQAELGAIRLVRGTMFSGQVVDPEGRGVADAALFIAVVCSHGPFGPEHLLAVVARVGQSDPAGRFRLEQPIAPDVNHHDLLVAVSPLGIGWCKFEPGKRRREVGDLVVRLRPNAQVRVVVQDPDGQPVADAKVTALPRFGPIGIEGRVRTPVSRDPVTQGRFTGRTDRSGEVELARLPIGEASLLHQDDDYGRRYGISVEAEGYPQQPLQECVLQPGASQLVVKLVRSLQLAVSVDVRDDLGAPIADAQVRASGPKPVLARTDARGHAELFMDATSGEMFVTAQAPGHRSIMHQLVPGSPSPVRMTLKLVRTRPLEGLVVDQLGQPLAGMMVFAGGLSLASTDDEGRFRAAAFPMGSQKISVALGSGMDTTRWTGVQTPEVVDVERGPVTITLERRPGSVDVRAAIVEAGSGQALEPTETFLALFTEEGGGGYLLRKQIGIEAGAGSFVARDCVAGRWRLSARTASGHRGMLDFALSDGQLPAELRLELPLPGAISGRLQFTGVAPPANVTLDVRHATPDRTAWTSYRYGGRWQVDAASQTVTGNEFGNMGSLRLQPARNRSFRLESADPTDTLVFTVTGDGVTGEASVRVEPGQSREVVVEVRARPPR